MKRSDFPILSNNDIAYLDNAATSLVPDEVQNVVSEFESNYRANVARGIYPWAETATTKYEEARAIIAKSLNCKTNEIVFTSGTTLGLNYVAQLVKQQLHNKQKVLITQLDHHSNILPWQINFAKDNRLVWLNCNEDGLLSANDLNDLIEEENIGAIAITHASNVTGEIIELEAITKITSEKDIKIIVDGAQFVPHNYPNLTELGVNYYVFSSHKCNAPLGLGVIYINEENYDEITPVIGGGGMVEVVASDHQNKYLSPPHCFEAGTPNISTAIALAKSFEIRNELIKKGNWLRIQTRLDDYCTRIQEFIKNDPNMHLLAKAVPDRVPIISFNIQDCHPHDVSQLLAQDKIYVRAGHHCAQVLHQVLNTSASVRISLGPHVNNEDIERLLNSLSTIKDKLT